MSVETERYRTAVKWLSLDSIFKNQQIFLFENGCNWRDAVQGALGNCWLISAFSSSAEYPKLVESLFETKNYSPGQAMKVRLFDRVHRNWVFLEVADSFPCDPATHKPLFSRPVATEAWVMVLEKAFAMLFGGYHKLDGGWQFVAWECMTGNRSDMFYKPIWPLELLGYYARYTSKPQAKRLAGVRFVDQGGRVYVDELWSLLKAGYEEQSLLGCGILAGFDTHINKYGLPGGHAYSILATLEMNGFRLLLVRNPWGNSVEWIGAWADGSSEWAEHPDMDSAASKIMHGMHVKPDGAWWMSIEDFVQHFDTAFICKQNPAAGTVWGEPVAVFAEQPAEGVEGEGAEAAEVPEGEAGGEDQVPALLLERGEGVVQYGAYGELEADAPAESLPAAKTVSFAVLPDVLPDAPVSVVDVGCGYSFRRIFGC